MKVSVYDTYVTKEDNTVMHFDILVDEHATEEHVFEFGKLYLAEKGLINPSLTTKECKFCHMELAPTYIQNIINEDGYFIIEMENCN